MILWIIFFIIGIGSIVIAFFSSIWCWIIIILSECILLLGFITHRKTKFNYIEEISENANYLFQKHSLYFLYPIVAVDVGGSIAMLAFVGLVVGIVNIINAFYIGIGIAITNWIITIYIALSINPSKKFNEPEKELSEEIFNYFNSIKKPNKNKKYVLSKPTDDTSE